MPTRTAAYIKDETRNHSVNGVTTISSSSD